MGWINLKSHKSIFIKKGNEAFSIWNLHSKPAAKTPTLLGSSNFFNPVFGRDAALKTNGCLKQLLIRCYVFQQQ